MTDIRQFVEEAMQAPCIRDLFGIALVECSPGAVTLALDHRPELGHLPGWFQGAITTAIAEYAAGLSALTLAPGRNSATLQQNIHFTGSARGQRLVARGLVIASSRTFSTIEARVEVERDGTPYPCATMTMTVGHRD